MDGVVRVQVLREVEVETVLCLGLPVARRCLHPRAARHFAEWLTSP
jgi:hypothetical protein